MKRLLGLCFVWLVACSPAWAAWTISKVNTTTNWNHGTTHTVTLTTNVAIPPGDIVAILATANLATAADAIIPADSVSDTFTAVQCVGIASNTHQTLIAYAVTAGISSGGSFSISDTTTGSTPFVDGQLQAWDISGGKSSSVEDITARACGGNASSVSSANLTSGAAGTAGDLQLGVVQQIGSLTTATEDASWTTLFNASDTSSQIVTAEITNAGTAAVSRTVGFAAARTYVMQVLALSPAGGTQTSHTLSLLGAGK